MHGVFAVHTLTESLAQNKIPTNSQITIKFTFCRKRPMVSKLPLLKPSIIYYNAKGFWKMAYLKMLVVLCTDQT